MFRCSQAAGIAVWVFIVAPQAAAQDSVHYSRSGLRKMVREADAENRDYERLQRMVVPAKYPTRADTARGLRDYYSYRASQMASIAAGYEIQLSRLDPTFRPVTPVESPAAPPLSENEKMLVDRIERLERQIGPPRTQSMCQSAGCSIKKSVVATWQQPWIEELNS